MTIRRRRRALGWGAAFTVAFMVRYLYRMWRDGRRSAAPVERNATARSVELTTLLTESMHGPIRDAAQLDRFRCNVLKLIASYVRDHRCDSIHPTIYANLLIEDAGDLLVLARDSDHREHMARHPKSRMLAWTAMVANQAMYTGDLYKEFPDTPAGKPYKSILVGCGTSIGSSASSLWTARPGTISTFTQRNSWHISRRFWPF